MGSGKQLAVLVGRRWRIIVYGMLLHAAVGCRDTGGFQVTGSVTYGGRPLQSGHVIFVPEFNNGVEGPPSRWGDVKAGRYSVRGLLPGNYTITVTGTDLDTTTPGGDFAQLFPPSSHAIELTTAKTLFDVDVPNAESESKR